MLKVKFKKVVLTFILFFASFLLVIFFNVRTSFAHDMMEVEANDWNVEITNNAKDLKSEETKEILFEVEDNPNVAKGKLAPGLSAKAELELNLIGTKYDVDFTLQADTSFLPDNFVLTAKIDDETYELGEKKTIKLENKYEFDEENGHKKITLILKWKDSINDNNIQQNITNMEIPITWTIEQSL